MAEGGSDGNLDSLTDAQKDILHNFQDFTAINDLGTCIAKLEGHDWNLESAVNDTFGITERPNTVEENTGNEDSGSTTSSQSTEVTPQRVKTGFQQNQVQQGLTWTEWLTGWLWVPYRFTIAVITDLFHFIGGLIWPRFGRGRTDPVEDVLNFKKAFEDKYGQRHPTFYQGSYGQVLSDARKELRFLLAYLHSEDHQDTNKFCTTVLCNEGFTEYVNGNMLFWACDVNSNEGYKVSRVMRESTYPFLAVVCLRDTRMTIVWRMNGFLQLDEVIAMLACCVDENEPALVAARAQRRELDHTQVIRQEQDEAYRESLLEDQRKAKKRQEEENERRRIEQEKQEKLLEKERRLQEIVQRREECRCNLELLEEPSASDVSAVRIRIKLPNGSLLDRRFHRSDKVKSLFDFAYAHENSPASFFIVSNFPRKTFSQEEDGESTLDEAGLKSGGALFLQDTTEDSSDEESS